MAQWQRRLEIKEEWKRAKNREIKPSELCAIVATKLKEMEPFSEELQDDFGFGVEEIRQELIADFESAAQNTKLTFDGFDEYWERLYDWADTKLDNDWNGKKVCWVNIF